MQAMIFAAGMGTRLKPLTDTLPKALIPICGRPMLEHLIIKLKKEGFSKIVINVHHFADKIIDFLSANNNFDIDIKISDERNALLDTGGGIKHAEPYLNNGEPFLVHNVDIISNVDLGQIYRQHCSTGAFATLLASERKTNRYLLFNDDKLLRGWINLSTGEIKGNINKEDIKPMLQYAFGGIHVISPKIFANFTGWDNKFSIIDYYLAQAEQQEIRAYYKSDLRLIDIGKLDSLQQAQSLFADIV